MNFENFKIIRPGDAPAEPVQEEVADSGQSTVVDTPVADPVVESQDQGTTTETVIETTPPVTPDFDALFKEKVGGKFERFDDFVSAYEAAQAKSKLLEDPFLDKLVNQYHTGEDITPYIHAKSMNYDAMALEDLARVKVQQTYPKAPQAIIDGLVEQSLEKYGDLTDESNALGKFMFETDMNKVREELKAEQQKYLVPDADSRQSPTKEATEKLRQQMEAFNGYVDAHAATQSLLQSNKIAVRYGDEDVNVGVENPSELIGYTKDTNEFLKLFVAADGSADIAKFLRVAAYAKNPTAFEATLINFGKTKGTTAVIDKLQNPVDIQRNGGSAIENLSMAEGIKRALKNQ